MYNVIIVLLSFQLQVHKHTHTCYKNDRTTCRFGFPRPVSDITKVLDEDEAITRGGRFCVHKRGEADVHINSYNEVLLRMWKANIDIQPCCNATVAYYVAKYIGKAEKQQISRALREAFQRNCYSGGQLQSHSSIMQKIATKIFSLRELSAPEAAFRLTGLTLRENSRKVVFVNNRSEADRLRFVSTNSPQNGNVFAPNIVDK